MFDWEKPSVQMLGRWQPWHKGHMELFKKAHAITGQVVIMCRTVPRDKEANQRVPGQDDNPFDFQQVKHNILEAMKAEDFKYQQDYIILQVPNIVDISYGRGVGYTFTEHDLGEQIHQISATKIRAQMRKDGKL